MYLFCINLFCSLKFEIFLQGSPQSALKIKYASLLVLSDWLGILFLTTSRVLPGCGCPLTRHTNPASWIQWNLGSRMPWNSNVQAPKWLKIGSECSGFWRFLEAKCLARLPVEFSNPLLSILPSCKLPNTLADSFLAPPPALDLLAQSPSLIPLHPQPDLGSLLPIQGPGTVGRCMDSLPSWKCLRDFLLFLTLVFSGVASPSPLHRMRLFHQSLFLPDKGDVLFCRRFKGLCCFLFRVYFAFRWC